MDVVRLAVLDLLKAVALLEALAAGILTALIVLAIMAISAEG